MARYQNPFAGGYPTDPAWAAIGSNLATALFGDPEARAVAEQRRAEIERNRAAAGYDMERTRGQTIQNNARASITGGLANFFKPQSTPEPMVPEMPGLPEASVSGATLAPVQPSGVASAFLDPLRGRGGAPVKGGQYGAPRDYGAHQGADFTAPMGTKVFPRMGGGKAIVSRSPKGGNIVTIDYGNGVTSKSMHLGDVFVQNGQVVTADTPIGTVGMTGRTTGPHLHEEVTIGGKRVDPTTLSSRQMPATVSMPSTATSSPAGTVSKPVLAPEPGGPEVDLEKFSEYMAALARAGEGGHADGLAGVMFAAAGGDQNARKALLARGQQPGKDFAASRAAQLNNVALGQYGSLAEAMSKETLSQAGSTQREGLSQAGQNERNTADNAMEWRKALLADATARRGQDLRADDSNEDGTSKKRGLLIDPGKLDEEIDSMFNVRRQTDGVNGYAKGSANGMPGDLKSLIRARAAQIAGQTGNIPGGVQQAVRELGVQYNPNATGAKYTYRKVEAPPPGRKRIKLDSKGNILP